MICCRPADVAAIKGVPARRRRLRAGRVRHHGHHVRPLRVSLCGVDDVPGAPEHVLVRGIGGVGRAEIAGVAGEAHRAIADGVHGDVAPGDQVADGLAGAEALEHRR